MLNWFKKLFKKKEDNIVFYEVSIQTQLKKTYNRDKKGRFMKKGKKCQNT